MQRAEKTGERKAVLWALKTVAMLAGWTAVWMAAQKVVSSADY